MLRFLGLSFVSVRDLFDAIEERSETEVIRLLDEGVNVNGRCEPVSVFLLVYPTFFSLVQQNCTPACLCLQQLPNHSDTDGKRSKPSFEGQCKSLPIILLSELVCMAGRKQHSALGCFPRIFGHRRVLIKPSNQPL